MLKISIWHCERTKKQKEAVRIINLEALKVTRLSLLSIPLTEQN